MANASDDPMSVPGLLARKGTPPPLVVLTAYDFPTARLFDDCGVDVLLVGDTLGVVVQGHAHTLSVTMDQMVYHAEMVSRAARKALVVADMPFLSYQAAVDEAVRNAGRLLKEGGAQAVKLEGGVRSANTIAAIADAHIPVMGHVGLTPQSIHKFGKYRAQRDEERILADAKAVEQAGAFSLVLETVPAELARKVTDSVSIPVIGIGAGPACDGQVLVWQDAFGLTVDFKARYVKRFADLHSALAQSVQQYSAEVRSGDFPDVKHSYR